MEKREILFPASEQDWLNERLRDVTSTGVAALFNLSPYQTEFEVWHRHAGGFTVAFESNERMTWGTRLQTAIGKGVCEDQGWANARPAPEYIRIPSLRMGASFDWFVGDDTILEIKNVDSLAFRDGWETDGEAPPHIELQVQYQMLVSGRSAAYIAALVGGNRIVLLKREPQPSVVAAIKEKVGLFWASIDANKPPAPDFKQDAEFISKLYGTADGSTLDASQDASITGLAERYKLWSETAKVADAEKQAVKAELLTKIGTASKVLGHEFTISASVVKGGHVEYDRADYRNFKINFRKPKEPLL